MKKVSVGVTVAVAAIAAAVAVTISYEAALRQFNGKLTAFNERQAMYEKLSETDTLVRQTFFGKIDEEKLEQALCEGYLQGLEDENATFYTAAAYKEQQAAQSTLRTDVGLDVAEQNGKVYITRVQANGPAAQTELRAGDMLLTVNGQRVNSAQKAEALLCAPEGEAVMVQVQQDNTVRQCEMNVEIYAGQSVFSRVTGDIGIVQITGFYKETAAEFADILQALQKQQIKGMIIDLRGCRHGTAENMHPIADSLLGYGPTVRYTDRDGRIFEPYVSGMKQEKIPLKVLTDRQTAGAAELFAAAIQDFGRGGLFGTPTAGEGCFVQFTQLSDGSALALTGGLYIRADGTLLQDMGVHPETEIRLEEQQEIWQRCGLLADAEDAPLAAALANF